MHSKPASPAADSSGRIGQHERTKWFDNLIGTIRSHQLQIDTNIAPKDLSDFYNSIMEGQADSVLFSGKQAAKEYFVTKIIFEYLNLIRGSQLSKLAFDHNDSEVLVWAEITDDDDELEKKLILSEAEVNAKFHQYGFHICSIIVEKSEELPIPNHYHELTS